MIKNKKISNSFSKITTIFGYSLFALMVVSFLVSTAIPFSFSFEHPGARHFNIVIMVVVFAIATIVPALASYFIGDRATHSKNKSLHHYNGVLFGIAAYWVMMLFNWIGYMRVSEFAFPAHLITTNVVPVILTVILMATIAITYTKSRKSNSPVLNYRPFQIVLIISVIGSFIIPYGFGNYESSFNGMMLVMLSIPVIATGVAYMTLYKHHVARLARLSDAVVALTMGWVTIWLAQTFISFLRLPYQAVDILAYVVGLIVFVLYLYLLSCKYDY